VSAISSVAAAMPAARNAGVALANSGGTPESVVTDGADATAPGPSSRMGAACVAGKTAA